MADVVIYTTQYCPFCIRAKQLLSQKGVEFNEVAVDHNPELRAQMAEQAGRTSVPQIWINEQHIGGCDDLFALQRAGKLDTLLAQ